MMQHGGALCGTQWQKKRETTVCTGQGAQRPVVTQRAGLGQPLLCHEAVIS